MIRFRLGGNVHGACLDCLDQLKLALEQNFNVTLEEQSEELEIVTEANGENGHSGKPALLVNESEQKTKLFKFIVV